MTMIPHPQKHPQDRHFRLRAMTMFIGESIDTFDDDDDDDYHNWPLLFPHDCFFQGISRPMSCWLPSREERTSSPASWARIQPCQFTEARFRFN